MKSSSQTLIIILLVIFLISLSAFSLMMGPSGFSPLSLMNLEGPQISIFQYRLSRILLAIVAGTSLAASGASLQAIFRNQLADPHLFGISGGAALGASIVIAFFLERTAFMPSAGAIIGGLLAFILVFSHLHLSNNNGPLDNCLLVGVLINSLAAALITLLKISLPMNKTQSLLFWLVGHITVVEATHFFLIIPLWITGLAALFLIRGELEIMSFGYDESRLLGINAKKIIKIAIAANCILIGNVVAFAGMIGFLGLVVPHLIRLLVDANLRVMLPIATICGGILLVFFDLCARLSFVIIKSEIPVGALSALVLSPLFFVLLLKSHHEA